MVERSEPLNNHPSSRAGKTQKLWKLFAVILLCLGSVGVVTGLVTLSITDKSSVSQTKSPLLPAVDPSHISVIAKATEHQDPADQTLRGRLPIDPIVYAAFGSIAAGTIPQLLEPTSRPSDLESPAVAALASAPAPIAEVPAEPNFTDSSAGPRNDLARGVPSQTASAAIDLLAPLAGLDAAHKSSGRPIGPKLSAADVAALLARGDDQLRLGDVTSARLFYEHAAESGEANAALRLGATFDPVFLENANLRGVSADMEKAVFWYSRARDLGSNEADKLLKDLAQVQSSDH